MSSLVRSVADVFEHEGPWAVAGWGVRWTLWKLGADPLYRKLLDDSITRTVDGTTVEFPVEHTSVFYDFRNDFDGEREIIRSLMEEARADDVFYDIGANIGLYTCFLGQRLSEGTVVAFDPDAESVHALRDITRVNDVNVTVKEVALMNERGEDVLLKAGPTQGAIASDDIATADGRTIPVRRGDDLCHEEGLPSPTLLKIDVEGKELDVLRGFESTLKDPDLRIVVVEVHPRKLSDGDASVEEIETTLRSAGFETERIGERRSQLFLQAKRN